MSEIDLFGKNNHEEALELLRKLCVIPAPSHNEKERAEFCKNYLLKTGAKNVYIDEANNVIYELNCEGKNNITVFAAHTDTVFPDTESYLMREDDDRIYCPGVGDDTAQVVVLMLLAKYFTEKNIAPENGVMFVMNSCEEGLGNLHGTRTLMKNYEGRIGRFITFDANIGMIYNRCVGSHRYKVEVLTQGGHSFSMFGKKNAISEIAKIISAIYEIKVPDVPGTRTTYNVGRINGGTSVNTIAQNASMLCEYRSDDKDCLAVMKKSFEKIFDDAKCEDVKVNVELIGERPCMGEIDRAALDELINKCTASMKKVTGKDVVTSSASTDCNIPLSLGIPSVCIGVIYGDGAHTREEYVIKDSLYTGLEIAIETAKNILEI